MKLATMGGDVAVTRLDSSGEQVVKLRKKDERRLDGRTWDEFPSPNSARRLLVVNGTARNRRVTMA